jgi:hypothetical protein
MATKRMSIKFGADGLGTLSCVGGPNVSCGGQVGRDYPNDLPLFAKEGIQGQCGDCDKFKLWINSTGDRMPWALKIWGQVGIFIHEWPQLPGSSGCIHLLPDDAKSVYDWVDSRTRVLIEYPW